jgi:ankyrin repeat protein
VARLLAADPGLARQAGAHAKTGLHLAAERDQVEAARLLLDAGADPGALTTWNATPLDWAATMGSVRVADLLLARGAGPLSLLNAAALGRQDRVRDLLADGSDPATHRRRDAPGQADEYWPEGSAHIRGDVVSDALYAAARNGHTATVAWLLDQGADVNAAGVFGGTALHWAAINGHAGTVQLLLARGASRTARDGRFDATPAGWAEEGGHRELAAMLRP